MATMAQRDRWRGMTKEAAAAWYGCRHGRPLTTLFLVGVNGWCACCLCLNAGEGDNESGWSVSSRMRTRDGGRPRCLLVLLWSFSAFSFGFCLWLVFFSGDVCALLRPFCSTEQPLVTL